MRIEIPFLWAKVAEEIGIRWQRFLCRHSPEYCLKITKGIGLIEIKKNHAPISIRITRYECLLCGTVWDEPDTEKSLTEEE